MNKFFLQGRLGKDPEQKTSASTGKKYVLISVADSLGKGKDGQEKTQWFNVFLFDKQADNAVNYLYKGASVFVEGTITKSEKGDIYSAKEVAYLSAPKPKALDVAVEAVQKAQNCPVDASANANHTNMHSSGFVGPMSDFDDIPF